MNNILWVNHNPAYGGPHNRALRLSRPLAARGWHTHTVLPEESGAAFRRFIDAGVPVVQLPLHRPRLTTDWRVHAALVRALPREVANIRREIRRIDARVVVGVGFENPHALIAAHLERRPFITQLVGTLLPHRIRAIASPFVRLASSAVMTTGTTVAALHPGIESMGHRWVPFFSPVDTDLFRPDSALKHEARRRLGVSAETTTIGMVSNLVSQKDHATFLRAAAQLKASVPQRDLTFVLVGQTQASQTAYFERTMQLAAELGFCLGEDLLHVQPTGSVHEISSAFDVAWFAARPRGEGVPTVVMESMAQGQPVVATSVAGVPDAINHRVNGILVPAGDATALAHETDVLLGDPQLAARLGAAAREKASREFGIEACLRQHLLAFDAAVQWGPTSRFRDRASSQER